MLQVCLSLPRPAALFLLVFALALTHAHALGKAGLTFDLCSSLSDCAGNRTCLNLDPVSACATGDLCACIAFPFHTCDPTKRCEAGEICAKFNTTRPIKICASCTIVKFGTSSGRSTPLQSLELCNISPSPTPQPTQTPLVTPTPVNSSPSSIPSNSPVAEPLNQPEILMDPCSINKLCPQKMECKRKPATLSDLSNLPDCQSAGPCICIPRDFLPCESTADCPSPKRCVSPKVGEYRGARLCVIDTMVTSYESRLNVFKLQSGVSRTPQPRASPDVCVDAKLLRLRGIATTFAKDRWANVLCDVHGSCATGGHMVTFEGVAMRMREYCEKVGCVAEQRWVNSPRMQWGVRVKGHSDGLMFTALASRWEWRMENWALRRLVHAGA